MSYLIRLAKAIPNERRKKLFLLVLLSFLSAFLQTLNVALLKPFLESISSPAQFVSSQPFFAVFGISQANLIYSSCFLFMALCIVSGFARVKINNYSNYISSDIGCCLSDKINSYVEGQPYSWHVNTNSSNVISTLTNNLNQTLNLIKTLTLFIPNTLLILVLFGSLIALEPKVIGFVLIMMSTFYLITYKISEKKAIQIGRDRRIYHNIMIRWIQVLLSSIKSIKLENNSQHFLDQISESNRVYRESIVKNKIIQETPKFLVEPFFVSTVLIIIIVYEYNGISIQELTEPLAILAFGFSKLIQPIQQIYQTSNSIKNNKSATEAVLSLIDTKNQSYQNSSEKNLNRIDLNQKTSVKQNVPLLCANNLSYKYCDSDNYILENININVYAGDTIALVGETGCGKSTLMDLLMGILTPTKGEVLYNGINIKFSKDQWKSSFAYVPQNLTFADDSIANNIAFYRSENIDLSQVSKVVKRVNLSGYIDSLDKGLDTKIVENGLNLSGGQRQRLCIARALYKNTNVFFLDEATSALDNNTESLIMNNLYEMNATIILIAHRLSTTKKCSKILYLEDGRVVNSGTYDELMTSSEKFKKLANESTK